MATNRRIEPEPERALPVHVYRHDTGEESTTSWTLPELLAAIGERGPAEAPWTFVVGDGAEYLAISTEGPRALTGQHPLWGEGGKFEGAMIFADLSPSDVHAILRKLYQGRRAEGCFARHWGRFEFYRPERSESIPAEYDGGWTLEWRSVTPEELIGARERNEYLYCVGPVRSPRRPAGAGEPAGDALQRLEVRTDQGEEAIYDQIVSIFRRLLEEGGDHNFVIFVGAKTGGRSAEYYVQFATSRGSAEIYGEAVSNHYLERSFALGRRQKAELARLGWSPPRGKHPNYYRYWQALNDRDLGDIAAVAITTLRRVYGWRGDKFLEVKLHLDW